MSDLTSKSLVVTDEKLIRNLECIIRHLRDGNTYTSEDKELLMYQTEEYVTGERKKMDPELLKYLFTGWFIHTQLPPPAESLSIESQLPPPAESLSIESQIKR